jgi:hypothetical protein
MDTAEQVRGVAVSPRPRAAWLDWVLSLAWALIALPLALGAAVLEGLLIGEREEE